MMGKIPGMAEPQGSISERWAAPIPWDYRTCAPADIENSPPELREHLRNIERKR